jgi:nucleoside-diphosphate-sugar epimerase
MTDDRLVVLLTGANGFVGRNIAPVLMANGMNVRLGTRKLSSNPRAVIVDNIGPQTDWAKALAGVDAVVHLAARVHHPREEHAADIYNSINAQGTINLARCAAKAGVTRFVYLSTALVNGSNTDGRPPFREDDNLMPRGVYGVSKANAELHLKELASDTTMQITVVRPPLIYGRGALGNFRLLVKAVERGIPLPFRSISNRRAFLSVENLASFIVHRLANPGGKFDVYLLADEEQVSTANFVARIARALGKRSRLVPLPLFALRASFYVTGRLEAFDSVARSLEIDISKSLETGWSPPLSLDEGLRNALHAT